MCLGVMALEGIATFLISKEVAQLLDAKVPNVEMFAISQGKGT